ncbi:MAG TPA: PEGA domain-containing protein [Pyrinomonadaceae bacterium]|nr:PEGA domain-containing protein [Pyrinomonadaceae bacterium]
MLNAETNTLLRTYSGQARNLELPPGQYQIRVSKEGYKEIAREISLKAGSTTLLDPSIEELPKAPAPSVRNKNEPPFRPDTKPQVQASISGKFIVVVINGRSADTSAVGAIDIKLTSGDDASAYVSGMLPGFSCQVDLIRFENVAEYSFVEPPGVANQWARVVVRVRPKSSNRPVHFAINWKTLGSVRAAHTPIYYPGKPLFAFPKLGEGKVVDVSERSLAYAAVGLWPKPSYKEALCGTCHP